MTETLEARVDPSHSEVRTFLIADVRGYMRFTLERGDEATAQLAQTFARIAREVVTGRAGTVLELRGDEALAVFTSPRQALRAAVELQGRFAAARPGDRRAAGEKARAQGYTPGAGAGLALPPG